jgi:hypothetical protein
VPAGQVEDLADVRLGGAAADDGAHGRHGATTAAVCSADPPAAIQPAYESCILAA